MEIKHYFCNRKQTKRQMTQKELRSYRLNSSEEPTDEMLHAIMLGVQETARQSTIKAENEIKRRFREMENNVARRRQKQQKT